MGSRLPGADNFVSFQGKNGNLMKSPWPFVASGASGKMISSLLPNMARHADQIAFVHSMTSKTNTHGPGCVFMNTGHVQEGFPSAGAWVSYALGSANENLPTYVALPDIRGEPPNGKANWSNGFLPAQHQAIVLGAQLPIRNLQRPGEVSADEEQATRDFLGLLNARHAEANPGSSELQARVAAYQLAARMQMSAPEVNDLAAEPESTHKLYGTDDANPLKAAYARNCLLARRLLERGVRYVNLYCASRASGVDGLLNWDAHKTLKSDYERHCPIFDQPTAALADRPETARAPGRHAGAVDHRVRTHADAPSRHDRPGPQPRRLHVLDDGGRSPRRHQLRCDRRVWTQVGGQPRHGLGFLRHRTAIVGVRPQTADVVLQRPRSPLDRRPGTGD